MTTLAGQPTCLIVMPRLDGPQSAGDSVVFRHVLRQLDRSMRLVHVELEPISWPQRLRNLVSLSCPPELARHIGEPNRSRVDEALARGEADVICFLHEAGLAFVDLAQRHDVPAVMYPHNVHSVVAQTDDAFIGRIFGGAARAFERRWYGAAFAELVCISRLDAEALMTAGVRGVTPAVAPPGAPPPRPLAAHAGVLREFVMTGSYDWWRKRRHLVRFAREPGALPSPLIVTDLTAKTILGERAELREAGDVDWEAGLRFGLIVDGFAGGFKLKALEYVALNCAILSYCNVSAEFEGLPHAGEFVRHVTSKAQIAELVAQMEDAPGTVGRFLEFKQACLARYDWERCVAPLRDAILSRAASRTLQLPGHHR